MTKFRCTLLLLTAHVLLLNCTFRNQPAPIVYKSVATFPGLKGDIREPFGIAVRDDVIYVSDGAAGTIFQIEKGGAARVLADGLNTPSAIAFQPGGDLVFADTGSHTIRSISGDGTVSLIAGVANMHGANDGPAAQATFNGPIGLAVADDGTIYVSDTYNDRIRRIRDGIVTTIAGSERGFRDGLAGAAKFDTPLGIYFRGDNLLIADAGNARVRLIQKDGLVLTLAGSGHRERVDGDLSAASFVAPTAVTADSAGRIYVADGDAIRAIGGRLFPFVETLTGDGRGLTNGNLSLARFNRPSGIATGSDGELYVADSDNHVLRVVSSLEVSGSEEPDLKGEPLPLATRWPFDPPSNPREIAGTLGEIRGQIGPENKPVWFHNGLDIAGAYGETTKFIRDETVLDPHSAENFGTSRELLRLPLIGYIHIRLGRDKSDFPFGDPRFQFERDATGKLVDVRIRRGTRFAAGDALGTLNAMNHVHLIAGRSGREINALAALDLPGISDKIAPVVEDVSLFTNEWIELKPESKTGQIRLPDKVRIVVRAHDRMDGNSERRKLGVYRVGYQLLSGGSPLGEPVWPVNFDRMPSNDAVRFAYADGSQSGYSPNTIFDYIATNRVDGDSFAEGFLDASTLVSGEHTLRVFVADYFGNVTSRDVLFVK